MELTLLKRSTANKYGVTEKKKTDLDALTTQVIDATAVVQSQQAIVDALTEKNENFKGFLAVAENNKVQALSNRNLVDQVVQNAEDLLYNSNEAFNQVVDASIDTKQIATDVNTLINKLIFSVELINKLANVVIRQKALNPLISDDLVSSINKAGTDANNAIALTLVALKSTFAAQEVCLETESALSLEAIQSIKLYSLLSGATVTTNPVVITKSENSNTSIQSLLYTASSDADETYQKANSASIATTKQLNIAVANLSASQITLKSLQSGLAAATAAAYSN